MVNSNRFIATPSRTAEIMRQYDIVMKKSLGQNFLIDANILTKMIQVAQVDKNTTAIEIGPGIGALTEFLAQSAKQVLAFEIDGRFVNILQDTLSAYDNVQVYHCDILQVNFMESEFQFLKNLEDLCIVANLPYYITTPIVMHLMNSGLPFNRLVMMMQKEVADRMLAPVGTKAYNSLSIAIQNQMEGEIAFTVPKSVFIPQPNVDSAILVLKRRHVPLVQVDDLMDFERFVQLCFTQRRKTLWNNLKNEGPIQDMDQLTQVFNLSEIDPQRRAETLTIKEFEKLYQYMAKLR